MSKRLKVRSAAADPLEADVIVLGAGVAGLTATCDLHNAGATVITLEAAERVGGRIRTHRIPDSRIPIEIGAEFVHGLPPQTWGIIRAAGLQAYEVNEEHWLLDRGKQHEHGEVWKEFEQIMGRLDAPSRPDLSFREFLAVHAKDFSQSARDMARMFVEGFDAADASRVSAQALAEERRAGDAIHEERNFRLTEGYEGITDWLISGLKADRANIYLGEPVREVRWRPGNVEVFALGSDGITERYVGKTAIITLPVGVLKAPEGETGAVRFLPELTQKRAILEKIEMGAVVKVILRFSEPFWEELHHGSMTKLGFAHNAALDFPTWWTLSPVRAPFLVAWAGGPAAAKLSARHDSIAFKVVDSLADLLGVDSSYVNSFLRRTTIADWQSDPLFRGAYSYVTVGGGNARAELAKPIVDTLFFAGEATDLAGSGTVAGAIASGHRAARESMNALRLPVTSSKLIDA